jgi:hypothetical protein
MNESDNNFPLSATQARASGKTYFRSAKRCPKHGTTFFWAHNGKCMGCEEFDGTPVGITVKQRPHLHELNAAAEFSQSVKEAEKGWAKILPKFD